MVSIAYIASAGRSHHLHPRFEASGRLRRAPWDSGRPPLFRGIFMCIIIIVNQAEFDPGGPWNLARPSARDSFRNHTPRGIFKVR